jgi:uncharacterized protein YjbI with pentapeptide repeats
MQPLPDEPPSIEALFGDRRPLPRTETLAELDKIVENSSDKNRNFFIAYLGLLLYVQAIVFSTTDLQLLVSTDGLKLPIVDLTVPLVGFYVVVPILVIALHFNFLQNLESHHYKLMRWKDAHPGGTVPRSRIQPFLFDYALLESGSVLERWVRWANTLLVLNLAPITLGLLLLRYSDRQDGLVTLWHYFAFVFDSYLVWKLRLAFDRNKSPAAAPLRRHYWKEIPKHGLRGLFGLYLMFETALTLGTAWLPSEAFTDTILPFARATEALEGDAAQGLSDFAEQRKVNLPAWFKQFLKSFENYSHEDTRLGSWVLPRIAITPNETVWTPDIKTLETEAKLAGETDWVKYFNQQGKGFLPSSPEPANLRLVRLPSQHLPRAQLQNAKLEGAYLMFAQLQAADLFDAQLQAANLSFAKLQAANLSNAQLQAANLWYAQLQAADLLGAQLQAANLEGAQLQAADLRTAELQAANLSRAQLQAAELRYVQLQAANLEATQLQAANLRDAQLQAANLEATQLQAANLEDAEMQAANLEDTQLQAANLVYVELQAALFRKTALFGASLPQASAVYLGKPPFDDQAPDWKALESLALGIPEGPDRDQFLERIKQAETKGNNPDTLARLTHDPTVVYRKLLPEVCGWHNRAESRRVAVRGIRSNYQNSMIQFRDPEFPKTRTEIDRTLCQHPACADLKDDIDGLDCRPFDQAQPQPAQPKANNPKK